jgi:hypothetical protein
VRGTGRRTAVSVLLLAGLVAAQGAALAPATAVEGGHVTTPSTVTVAWSDQAPRHPGDATSTVRGALEDWRLRVSQTRDLLNQTVEVSWEGGASSGNATFLQLMQCWSDGPTVAPTREQCAFGGVDRDMSASTGSARTRQLGQDPREQTYRYDGDLSVVAVDGAAPSSTWQETSGVVLGASGTTCPAGTTGYTVELVPPRGTGLGELRVEGPTSTLPGSLSVQVGSFVRRYDTVTAPIVLKDVAAAHGLARLPAGAYRVQLSCLGIGGGAGAQPERARLLGWVAQTATPGTWTRQFHEGGVFVPFDPVGEGEDVAATDPYERDQVLEYLKPRATNEVWQARSTPGGTGSVFLEVQTDLEAQHLGCGRRVGGSARSCWLVAVPRWAGEPDGTEANLSTMASPLSQTNWDRRIEVPLGFAPVAAGCAIGSGLKQVLAHDSALSALRSWQPTFCGDRSTANSVLGPLQDASIRASVSKPNRLGVVGVPEEGRPSVVHAPLATSGVVIAFAVDRRIPYGAPGYELDGTRETTMNLTPRLVAKLLTQSYDSGAAPNGGKRSGYNPSEYSGGFLPTFTPGRSFPVANPRRLYDDPEFLQLNPAVAEWLGRGATLPPQDMADVLVAAGDADAYQVLWEWVLGDPDAKAFLAGVPDPAGMQVNPYYQGQLDATTSSFPLLDPTCVDNLEPEEADGFPPLCQINVHPRVEDDAEAAQSAVRGDTKRVNQAPLVFAGASGYRPEARQEAGSRGLLVVTTSAVAERFGLPTARLRNVDGAFVAASGDSLAAARAQMDKRADGVLLPRPGRVSGEGYPLTTMSYAIVDLDAATAEQRQAFATMLDYAAGEGQRPGTGLGQLPPGYAPLTPALAAQTVAASVLLRERPGAAPSPSAQPTAQPTDVAVAPAAGSSAVPVVVPVSVPIAATSPPAAVAPVLPPQVAVPAAATAAAGTSLRWVVPALALAALFAGLAGRVLLTRGGSPR